jgi:serine/threonine-protein kinase
VVQEDNSDVYVYNLARSTLSPLTFDPGEDTFPIWTPDGARVLFSSNRDGPTSVFSKAAAGTGQVEPVAAVGRYLVAASFSPDGETLVLYDRGNVAVMAMGGEREVEELVQSRFDYQFPELSPDGRWLAYESQESGRDDIYVRPFPNVDDNSWLISPDGGRTPVWGPDGRELFYRGLSQDTRMMVVPIDTEPTFSPGTPEVLFEGSPLLKRDSSASSPADSCHGRLRNSPFSTT